jgi:adenosylmethionine-8-amino-7-oxononanoate aminotransferase
VRLAEQDEAQRPLGRYLPQEVEGLQRLGDVGGPGEQDGPDLGICSPHDSHRLLETLGSLDREAHRPKSIRKLETCLGEGEQENRARLGRNHVSCVIGGPAAVLDRVTSVVPGASPLTVPPRERSIGPVDPTRDERLPFIPTGRGAPLHVERAEGSTLFTRDGRRILDAAGGAILVNVGHGRSEIARVVAETLEATTYVVPVFATEARLRLVDRLVDRWLPDGLERVYFTSGGSEAIDAAMRLARQHHLSAGRPERFKVIARDLSYHGATLATLAVGGHTKRRRSFEPMWSPLPKAPACYCMRCPLGRSYPECDVACADELERVIEREGPETVAAFLGEPIVGSTAGALVPPAAYWPRVAEICKRHGVLLIADEVMTGFGRTGRRFAVEHSGITPDIMVGGKGLAGGYAPIGAVFATEEVVDPIAKQRDDFMYYTYGAHPASCAAADKVLEILEREDLVRRAAEMGERLRKALAPLVEHPHVADVRGLGLLQAVELVRDRESLGPFPESSRFAGRVVAEGLARGVFFYPGGLDPARDVICLGPPFVVTESEIEEIARVLHQALDATARTQT